MDSLFETLPQFVSGFFKTLGLVALAAVGSVVVGTAVAACRVCPIPVLRAFGALYVSVVRNTPLAVVLFFFAFGIPTLGINASYYVFGLSALVLYTAAFVCEAERAGVNAVAPGQAEAARAIGLGFAATLTLVVLPQALRSVVPPLGNVLIAMVKNSAVLGAFGIGGELYSTYNRLVSAQGYARLPTVTGMALCYLVITLSAGALLARAERRLAVAR